MLLHLKSYQWVGGWVGGGALGIDLEMVWSGPELDNFQIPNGSRLPSPTRQDHVCVVADYCNGVHHLQLGEGCLQLVRGWPGKWISDFKTILKHEFAFSKVKPILDFRYCESFTYSWITNLDTFRVWLCLKEFWWCSVCCVMHFVRNVQ